MDSPVDRNGHGKRSEIHAPPAPPTHQAPESTTKWVQCKREMSLAWKTRKVQIKAAFKARKALLKNFWNVQSVQFAERFNGQVTTPPIKDNGSADEVYVITPPEATSSVVYDGAPINMSNPVDRNGNGASATPITPAPVTPAPIAVVEPVTAAPVNAPIACASMTTVIDGMPIATCNPVARQ